MNAVLEMDALPAGTTSVVSQSGTMLGTVLSRGAARGLGFAKLIAVGNEADLGVGELVELLVDDRDTRVILLFLETVRDAARLAAAARKAHAAGKPVVAYKLGRSGLGEALARSHTGALAGSDQAIDAYFRDCGIVRVDLLETLIEIAPLVAGRSPPGLARAPRVAVVTTTGGGAASVVDRLGTLGLEAAAPDEPLRAQLSALGVRVSDSPIVDLTLAGTSQTYEAVLRALLDSPACDAVLAAVGSSAMFHPQLAVEPILRVPRARNRSPRSSRRTPSARSRCSPSAGRAGVPHARGLRRRARRVLRLARAARAAGTSPAVAWPVGPAAAGRARRGAGARALQALGVPVVESAAASAPDYAHALAYPVAAKVRSPDIAHKTEAAASRSESPARAEYDARVHAMLAAVAAAHPGRAHRRRAGSAHGVRARGGDRRLSPRSARRADRARRRRRHAGRDLPRLRAAPRAGEPRRKPRR